jgi:RimJ/RimL family protein N-acetyltransferase
LEIRSIKAGDEEALWRVLEPTIRAGETYTLSRDMSREAALAYWTAPNHRVFVASFEGVIVGTYYMRSNQGGGGSHIANCGYITSPFAQGRGVARALCHHSLRLARELGYQAMQFNCVVSSNERAIKLWKSFGFSIVGTIPAAFEHPSLGFVDAYVMHRSITDDEIYSKRRKSISVHNWRTNQSWCSNQAPIYAFPLESFPDVTAVLHAHQRLFQRTEYLPAPQEHFRQQMRSLAASTVSRG